VMFGYAAVSGVTSSDRKGNNRLEPASLTVTALDGFPMCMLVEVAADASALDATSVPARQVRPTVKGTSRFMRLWGFRRCTDILRFTDFLR